MSRVAVIIVNWNTGLLLKRCLTSLANLNDRDLISKVLVVDNDSRDDSFESAQEQDYGVLPVEFITSDVNKGFAGGNNLAFRLLQDHGDTDSHILLLNPDTEVHDGALTALLDVLEKQKDTGVVGCLLRNDDGTVQPSVRRFPTIGVFIWFLLKLNVLWPRAQVWQRYIAADFDYTQAKEVDQVMGAAFLVRRSVADDLDLLDESFFVWFEEVDFCMRAQTQGWSTYFTPLGEITHLGGVSFNQLVGLRRSLPWLKSMVLYAYKHFAWWEILIVLLLAPLGLLLSVPAAWRHRLLRRITRARI